MNLFQQIVKYYSFYLYIVYAYNKHKAIENSKNIVNANFPRYDHLLARNQGSVDELSSIMRNGGGAKGKKIHTDGYLDLMIGSLDSCRLRVTLICSKTAVSHWCLIIRRRRC